MAAAQVCREAGPASPQTSTSGTWIWLCSTIWTAGVWRLRSWSHSEAGGAALQSTLLWSHRFVVTGLPGQERPTMTGPHSRMFVAKSPNCLGTGKGSPGGPCRGGWGQVERRDGPFLGQFGQGQSKGSPGRVAEWGPGGLRPEVERSIGLLRSSSVLCIVAGPCQLLGRPIR